MDYKNELEQVMAILNNANELNMSNYNHDDVRRLNDTFIEVYLFVESALVKLQSENCKLPIPFISVSLRDYIACEAMKAKIMVWDTELTNKHRQILLEDMIERYGNVTVNDALSMMCYEIADSILKARSNEKTPANEPHICIECEWPCTCIDNPCSCGHEHQ